MFILVAALALSQGSLLSRIVTHPDAANGYEDYLRAAELLDSRSFDEYLTWQGYVFSGRSSTEVPPRPSEVQENDPDLTIRERMVERFGQALQVLASGNKKVIYDPREQYRPETTFPEFYRFKSLARLESAAMHVAFSKGRSDEATADLLDGLGFANRVGCGPIISRLVGVACEAILTRTLNEHLPQLSLDDATKIHAFADQLLEASDIRSAPLRRDAKMSTDAIDVYLSDPKNAPWGPDVELIRVTPEISKLSPSEREQLKAGVVARVSRDASRVATLLDEPEENWLPGISQLPDVDDGTLAGKVASRLEVDYNRIVQLEARTRVRTRLLRLTAMIIECRWLNGKLPDRLEQFASPEDRRDRISGKDFVYRRDGIWFTLTSPGFGDYHNISLQGSPQDVAVDQPIRP